MMMTMMPMLQEMPEVPDVEILHCGQMLHHKMGIKVDHHHSDQLMNIDQYQVDHES